MVAGSHISVILTETMASTTLQINDKPYIVETSKIKDEDFRKKVHELDTTSIRHIVRLGDLCGLTKLGINLERIPSNSKSSVLHWHSRDDEWVYILEGTGTLQTLPDGEKEPREESVKAGDFIGFAAATRLAHVILTGDTELVFLCSGTREPVDVCTYPLLGIKLVGDRTPGGQKFWANETKLTYAPVPK